MNQLRLDPLSGRWVAVSTSRFSRSDQTFLPKRAVQGPDPAHCPFCPGHEDLSKPALETYSRDGAWVVRIVANDYPAFEGAEPFVLQHRGPVFIEAPASGTHEVIVFTREHDGGWESFDDELAEIVMLAIRDRIEEHQETPGLRYSQVIVNAGADAGASIEHPHGQLLGIPFVPHWLVDEQAGFNRFAGGCLLCTASASEERAGYRIVQATANTVTFAPFWSGTPYELLVVPRAHEAHLHLASPKDLASIGVAVRDALAALFGELGDIAYNLVFHAAPYRAASAYHWHVHILPKLTTRAGFEAGTGVLINVIAPEFAAARLKAALLASGHGGDTPANVAS